MTDVSLGDNGKRIMMNGESNRHLTPCFSHQYSGRTPTEPRAAPRRANDCHRPVPLPQVSRRQNHEPRSKPALVIQEPTLEDFLERRRARTKVHRRSLSGLHCVLLRYRWLHCMVLHQRSVTGLSVAGGSLQLLR